MNPYLVHKKNYDKIADEFEKLNEYQKAAVLNDEDILLLNASVGSGKTTVLINKVIYLHLIKKIPLHKMFVLTFTNKAANEIKNRFKEYGICATNEDTRFFGTFHSVAKKLMDESKLLESFGYKEGFSIADTDEVLEILTNLTEEKNLNIKYRNKIIKRVECYKKGQSLYGSMQYLDDIQVLISIFEEEKKANNVMDFDDLIDYCIEVLKLSNEKRAEYIIVDEFQDCNETQIEMIEQLAKKKAKIFAVGDPNQMIYSWRGSKLNIFSDFKEKCQAKELNLPVNYRSTTSILDVAKIFLNSTDKLEGIREIGNPIIINNHYNEFNEALYISEKIKGLISKEGYKFNDICILYRKQIQSKAFEDIFLKEDIPYEVSVRKGLRDIPVLFWFIRLLKSSINEYDRNSCISVLTDAKFGVVSSKKEAGELLNNYMKVKSRKSSLVKKIKEYKTKKLDLNEIYSYFEIDKYIKPTSSDYAENKKYITKFLEKLAEYIKTNELENNEGLREYISSSALYGTQIIEEKIQMERNSLKLMTLHSVKGLEFKYVFISGANPGLIPMRSRSEIEEAEERRLFFVGITRAKDFLEISYLTSPSDCQAFSGPSRYLDMIPPELKVCSKDYENIEETDIKKTAREIYKNRKEEKILVKHKKYGMGKIVLEDDSMVTVNFGNYGDKTFMKALRELDYL